MANVRVSAVSGLIETLFDAGSVTGWSDEQLVRRFARERDEAAERAFEVLVQRHGPMVLAVCRSALCDLHDAEDAFQATFLVLARKARSLHQPERLGPWLHGVARRTAEKMRVQRSRRQRLIERADNQSTTGAAVDAADEITWREVGRVIHDEIARLPDRYRAAVILCYLEGLSHEQASTRLGVPSGTVGVRLMRARERLQDRLNRRGLAPGISALVPFAPKPESLPATLVGEMARTASIFARRTAAGAPISAKITNIAQGVIRMMAIENFGTRLVAILVCGIIAAGSVALAFQSPARLSKAGEAKTPRQKNASQQAASKSILANGGFERGDSGTGVPESWKQGAAIDGVSYRWDRTVAHDGKASLHLEKTAQRYFPIAQWFQIVDRAGTAPRLKVSGFVLADTVTKAIVDVQFIAKGEQESHRWAAYIGAKQANDPPVTHPWKKYTGVVDIPAGTTQIMVALQIYGPGNVWFDDVEAEYTQEPATDATASNSRPAAIEPADADVALVPAEKRLRGGDPKKGYFLIGPTGTTRSGPPLAGYRLLVLLPGGDGSAEFHVFCKRIVKFALTPNYLVAQLVAVEWTPEQAQAVTWPKSTDAVAGVGFVTEDFVDAVINDVGQYRKVDPRFIFALGWSSGGPAVYAASGRADSCVTGAFVAMSVFKPAILPSLEHARGRGFYILHSPQDFIPIAMARSARDQLTQAGAKVELRSYEGGHGWRGDVYGEIRRGIGWLEVNHANPSSP
jgi:RNA polymerase sigma factor (sigma-70 family)